MKPSKLLIGLAHVSPVGRPERASSTKIPAPSKVAELPPAPLPGALPSPLAQGNISKNNTVLPPSPLPSALPSPFAQGSNKASIPTQGSGKSEAEMRSNSLLQQFRSVTPGIDGLLDALETVPGNAVSHDPSLPTTQIAPDLYYPNPIWFGRKKTENIRCYSYARNDLSYLQNPNPGSIGGKPIQLPLTCEKVLDASQKDGLKKPIEQAADGCSVKCPEDHHAVFVVVGDFEETRYVVQKQADGKTSKRYIAQPIKGEDFHYYRQDQNGRYSHKPGDREPTNLDGAGDEISCPPKALHAYTDTDTTRSVKIGGHQTPANVVTTLDYKPCDFLCAPTIPNYPGYKTPQQLLPVAGLERAMRSSNVSSYSPSERAKSVSSSSETSRTGR
jgi:hypothetical protein